MPAEYLRAAPYAKDAMNLPVRDVEEAAPFEVADKAVIDPGVMKQEAMAKQLAQMLQ